MRPVGSGERLERRRQRAIALLKEGRAPVEVARPLGVDRRGVRRWNATYRTTGRGGLAARPAPGRPWKLSAVQRGQLEAILVRGASACGFERDLWTCPRVARVIRRRFGISCHVDHIGRLLRALGWTPQRADGRGRPWREAWAVREGILWVLRGGARWKDLPQQFPPYQTCHRRCQQWVRSGAPRQVLEALAQDLCERGGIKLEERFIDGAFAPAKKGTRRSARPSGTRGPSSWRWRTLKVFRSPRTWRALRPTQ